jgi:hypothetical protein
MIDEQSPRLQHLLDRAGKGDPSARRELVGCTYERLRILARKQPADAWTASVVAITHIDP